jgi:outer membrane protein OmpA-like peptidoglycan-associated protein
VAFRYVARIFMPARRTGLSLVLGFLGFLVAAPAGAQQKDGAQRLPEPPRVPPVPKLPEGLKPGTVLPDGTKIPDLPPIPKAPGLPAGQLPQTPDLSQVPTDLDSAKEVVLAAAGEEVKMLLPDPEKLAEWFQGHGGAILGTGTQLVAPLGYVAGGDKNSFYRSHLPGLGLHGQIGMLFLRRFGATLHGAKIEHLKGTDAQERGSSWQIGASFLLLTRPEQKSPYLELGINRSSFSNSVLTPEGTAERSAASWDTRVGVGYMVLTKAQKFLYTPWAALDFGKFSSIEQTIGDNERSIELGDNTAWHYVINLGVTFAYHKKVPALMGPPPKQRPDDPDNDLILAPNDQCPAQQEDYYPPNPKDGCPSDDWDQDKIPNAADKCTTIAEDGLGPEPKDGCATTDRDQDGIVDSEDQCKTLREDKLGEKPADGCPNNDRDGDGIVDGVDKCADQPETKNDYQDDDGCPDEAPRVQVTEKAITIRDKLFFETGKAEVSPVSLGTIEEIVKVLKDTPSVELIEIQGHADNAGTPDRNRRITQDRANAVRKALIQRGVEPTRLTAVGYGEYCPLEPNAPDRGGNEKNRRVEFRILRVSGKPTGADTSCPDAVKAGILGTNPNGKGAAK